MIEKKKKYTYEKLKEMFDEAVAETVLNPFGDKEDQANEKMDSESKIMVSVIAMTILRTLESNLFEKEKKK